MLLLEPLGGAEVLLELSYSDRVLTLVEIVCPLFGLDPAGLVTIVHARGEHLAHTRASKTSTMVRWRVSGSPFSVTAGAGLWAVILACALLSQRLCCAGLFW